MSEPTTSSTERTQFARDGYVIVRGLRSASALASVRERLRAEVRRATDRRGASKALSALPVFQQITRLSSLVDARGVHDLLATPDLVDRVASLVEHRPAVVEKSALLLSPPSQGAWSVAGLNWHVDVAVDERDRSRVPGVQVFLLLDDVAPQGGATIALAGSHRIVAQGGAPLAALRALLRSPHELDEPLRAMGLRVVEMSGRAGDAYLMDMRVLHTPSTNASQRPRLMATCRMHL